MTFAPRRVWAALAISTLLGTASFAANLTYSDGICAYRVAFDPTKVDGAKLKSTFDYLADGSPSAPPPSAATAAEVAALDVSAYRKTCDTRLAKLRALRFVDGAGVEAVRDRQVAELEAVCTRGAAAMAGAKGDVKPLRAAAPSCARYADFLALPSAGLKARWNDMVLDLCTTSSERNVCAGHLQRSGEGPGSETRRRAAVLERWSECAAQKAPVADTDGEKRKVREALLKRFKAKTLSCAQ